MKIAIFVVLTACILAIAAITYFTLLDARAQHIEDAKLFSWGKGDVWLIRNANGVGVSVKYPDDKEVVISDGRDVLGIGLTSNGKMVLIHGAASDVNSIIFNNEEGLESTAEHHESVPSALRRTEKKWPAVKWYFRSWEVNQESIVPGKTSKNPDAQPKNQTRIEI